MDWDQVTQGWVADDLLQPEQRLAILQRLEALPSSTQLPTGSVVTVLVAPAAWLMVGAVASLLAATLNPPQAAYEALLGGGGGLLLVFGVPLRFLQGLRPVARGMLAASVPLLVAEMGLASGRVGSGMLGLMLIPALFGVAAALAENSRAIMATAASCMVLATWAFGVDTLDFAGARFILSLISLGLLALLALGSRRWSSRAGTLHVAAPLVVLQGAVLAGMDETFATSLWSSIGVSSPWAVEKGALLLVWGLATLALGLAARSGFVMVPGVLVVATATVWLAFAFGSFIGGAIALAVVSLGLLSLALLLWGAPMIKQLMGRSQAEEPTAA